jgi:hypothetical protein
VTASRVFGARPGENSAEVRPFFAGPGGPPEQSASLTSARSPVDEVAERLAIREAQIAEHSAALAAAYAEGEVAGRLAAEASFQEDRSLALKALNKALRDANTQLAEALKAFENLALLVAVEAIDKLTSNPETYTAMLVDAIGAQVRSAETNTVLTISVSRLDFPDTREIAALAGAVAVPEAQIKVCDDLDAGICRMDLNLGGIEIDMLRSRDEITALLARLAGSDS